RCDAKNVLRCFLVGNVSDVAAESIDDVGVVASGVGVADVGDGLSVTCRSVGDASPNTTDRIHIVAKLIEVSRKYMPSPCLTFIVLKKHIRVLRELRSGLTTKISPFYNDVVIDVKTEVFGSRSQHSQGTFAGDGQEKTSACVAFKGVEEAVKKTKNTLLRTHLFGSTFLPVLKYA
ncbi:unnamed protein product, partial [Heligmosomoides polygyrus]|uniref:Ribosomal_L18e/L15P domain-containing protein n=1 Tax=Heligmosomoides polygyrus TaxID=6339 RepID=A0A183GDZ7_HELPZ